MYILRIILIHASYIIPAAACWQGKITMESSALCIQMVLLHPELIKIFGWSWQLVVDDDNELVMGWDASAERPVNSYEMHESNSVWLRLGEITIYDM